MTNINIKKLLVSLVALTLFFANVAAGPIIYTDQVDDTFVTGYCGFPMEIHTTGTAVIHLFLNENGGFDHAIVTSADTKMTFTNLNTGESVWTPSVNMVLAEDNGDGTGTQSLRGLFWHLIVPGEGLITADVGRLDYLLVLDENGQPTGESEVVFSAGMQEGLVIPTMCDVLG